MHLEENNITQGNSFEDRLKKVLEELDFAIKEDPPLTIKEGGFIKESYSDELHEFKLIEKTAHSDLLELQEKYSQKTGIKSLKLKYNNVLGKDFASQKDAYNYFQILRDKFVKKHLTGYEKGFFTEDTPISLSDMYALLYDYGDEESLKRKEITK